MSKLFLEVHTRVEEPAEQVAKEVFDLCQKLQINIQLTFNTSFSIVIEPTWIFKKVLKKVKQCYVLEDGE